ncbi:hypothetical protein PPH41_33880, partial [Burkholderia gladioli]|nr:hypothetical protein [Burkholderia gladioli]
MRIEGRRFLPAYAGVNIKPQMMKLRKGVDEAKDMDIFRTKTVILAVAEVIAPSGSTRGWRRTAWR